MGVVLTTPSRHQHLKSLWRLLPVEETHTANNTYWWEYAFPSSMQDTQTDSRADNPPAQTEQLDTTWQKFYWNTPYTATENRTYTDELWEKILPSHGIVAIDRVWAREHNWPDSMYLPSDHSKGVYLLESYHYLHCLVGRHHRSQKYSY